MEKASKHQHFLEWECFWSEMRFLKVIPGGDTIVRTYEKVLKIPAVFLVFTILFQGLIKSVHSIIVMVKKIFI
jgi:hypothetical protein